MLILQQWVSLQDGKMNLYGNEFYYRIKIYKKIIFTFFYDYKKYSIHLYCKHLKQQNTEKQKLKIKT